VLALTAPFAMPKSRQNANRRVQPGQYVEGRHARSVSRSVWLARQAHQARHRLDDQIIAGQRSAAGTSEAADRAVDDTRVALANGRIVQPEAAQPTGFEVLDQHVTACGELLRVGEVVAIGQVERDRPLVAIDAQVVGGNAIVLRWKPGARVVARWALDFDHRRAEVAEQHGGIRTCQDAGEIGDKQPIQRPRLRVSVSRESVHRHTRHATVSRSLR
jgi:hypothetical protein